MLCVGSPALHTQRPPPLPSLLALQTPTRPAAAPAPPLAATTPLSAPRRYVDASGAPTEAYPFNPNGSPLGIAALCSSDGRHLAMMPHPERCFLTWQLPYHPADVGLQPKGPAPWLKLFQNARVWAEGHPAPPSSN